VAVVLPRGLWSIVSMLGIWKAGCAYGPLDPELPRERVLQGLEDSGCSLVIGLPGSGWSLDAVPVLEVSGSVEECLSDHSELRPESVVRDVDGLAYVIYTSGSTGRPKGVGNSHRGLLNRLLWQRSVLEMGSSDVVLQKTAVGFDVAVWEWFLPLMTGGCLVVTRPDGHRDPEYLGEMIARHGVTILHFVPSMLELFLEVSETSGHGSLRHVVTSG